MDQTQFASYLAQGLGRPYLFFQQHDPAPYIAELFQACLYNPAYDRQCEGSRATYFYQLIQLTNRSPWFRQQLLDALSDPNDAMDLDQLFDFALIYARGGDAIARRVLYEQAGEQASCGNTSGAYQLIDLDGLPGFLFIANRFGEAMQSDHTLWDDNHLLRHLESIGEHHSLDRLRAAANPNYPYVSSYLDAIAATQAQQHQAPRTVLVGKPYLSIREHIDRAEGRFSFSQLKRWGATADDVHLKQAAADFLQETEPQRILAYLAIFGKRAFPFGSEALVPYIWNKHERIARWSIQAISQFQEPSVRNLGFTLIQAHHHVGDALDIFIRNYQAGDDRYLADLLARAEEKDLLHAIGFGLNDIFIAHPNPTVEAIFLDLYERGPCSLCRERFVERLLDINCLPSWMETETQYDANPNIHQTITKHWQG
jgi:hypothetical protein